jgi:hypothetical protein
MSKIVPSMRVTQPAIPSAMRAASLDGARPIAKARPAVAAASARTEASEEALKPPASPPQALRNVS